jgi:hypothetical protein
MRARFASRAVSERDAPHMGNDRAGARQCGESAAAHVAALQNPAVTNLAKVRDRVSSSRLLVEGDPTLASFP